LTLRYGYWYYHFTRLNCLRGEVNFIERLTEAAHKNRSLVCVGLDPDPQLMPRNRGVFEFNRAIIEATADLVCAYKVNFAFYEALADEGFDALKRTIRYIPDGIPVIADAKRGDIGNTARAYAKAIFDNLNCDAATVSPYLGFDSIEPFISYRDSHSAVRGQNRAAARCLSSLPERPASGTGMVISVWWSALPILRS